MSAIHNQSKSLQMMHLENLIYNLVPTKVLDKHGDIIDKLDQYDAEIASFGYKIEQLRVKRLRLKYELITACLNDMPFNQARALIRSAVAIDKEFLNHAEVIKWMKDHHDEITDLLKKGMTNEITSI